jgi:hypothetical protein
MPTVYETRRARFDQCAINARSAAADAVAAEVAAMPHIGKLIRKGRTVYYVNAPLYRESENPRDLA